MFKKLLKAVLPNPLDWIIKKAKKRGNTRFLLAWNRGLGDIALGLYAIVHRIKTNIPNAQITFLIRENLKEGFSLFDGVKFHVVPSFRRGVPYNILEAMKEVGLKEEDYDVLIEKPDPTYWVKWQRGKLTPKLKWSSAYDSLYKSLGLDEKYTYIAVQIHAETNYGLWRNWPISHWESLFNKLQDKEMVRILLLGFEQNPKINLPNVIDLRGKTTLLQVISLVKNLCSYLIVPDSGILSMLYYLDASFPLKIISFWGDPRHGVLKQRVASPNPMLSHIPLIGKKRDLSSVSVEQVCKLIE